MPKFSTFEGVLLPPFDRPIINQNERNMMIRNELLTRQEVSDYLGVCPHTVRSYELRGLLPRIGINSRVIRYRKEHVELLLDKLTMGGGAIL
jgi:hypothetical protein